MFDNVYIDSWAVADNTVILNVTVIAIAIAIGVIAIAVNAIRGISIFKMAKEKNISLAILSFFPFVQGFVLGQLADDFKKTNFKKVSINRFLLPITTLAKWVVYIVLALNISSYIKDFALLCKTYPDWIPLAKGLDALGSYVIPFVIVFGLFLVVSFINHVIFTIATHRVFAEYKPTTAAVMTAISFMFGGIMSLVMLFVAKNKEKQDLNYTHEVDKAKAYI